MTAVTELLEKHWGYSAFRPLQQEIIRSVLSGSDTLAILATGSGKSLCYQLPALCHGGLTLVISPLIALMKDQVDDLNHRGIPAAAWTSAQDAGDLAGIRNGLIDGTLRILFVSPERSVQPAFLACLKKTPLRLIAIDEAHCISAWGHNFRPEYRQLITLRRSFPQVTVIALTATATPDVRKDIIQQLDLKRPREFVGSFDRKNLRYCVREKKNPLVFIAHYLGQHRTGQGIIYCLSRNDTEEIARDLQKRGFSALAYHAGLSRQALESVQDSFLKGTVQVICATVAFGMGIDKPDVRFVIHHTLPRSLEAYYQETGRAGRDGLSGECILLFSKSDAARLRSLAAHDSPGGSALRIALAKLQAMTDFCETTSCRRRQILRYFGEAYPHDTCGSCDTCENPVGMADCTEAACLIARCILALSGRFGSDLISDVLRGSKGTKITGNGFDLLSVYGKGKQYSRTQYRSWIAELVRQGFLERTGDQYPVIGLTARGRELLAGRVTVMLPAPVPGPAAPGAAPVQDTADAVLFEKLKGLRKELAGKYSVLPYMIFPDKCLKEMAAIRPLDRAGLATISGVGPYKLTRYGPAFLEVLRAA
ncbi:MAG: DNA helicase RecQ [Methanomicrobiales archaeon]|nr:DNA helicase RecQ [Methanomicrobiales archaeon]